MGPQMTAPLLMFGTAMRTEQRGLRHNPLLFIYSAVVPVTFLIITLSTSPRTPGRVIPVVWGAVLTALWGSTVWMAGGVLRRERTYGTLGRVVTGGYAPFLILSAKSAGATLYASAVIAASSAVTTALLRAPVRFGNPPTVALAIGLLFASASALGTLLSCLFLVTRHGLQWSSTLLYPVFLLGGLLIPPDQLVPWLRWVPYVLSLHWVDQMLVHTAQGYGLDVPALLAATTLAALYFILAWLALRQAVTRARKSASLDFI
jgi:ABC-2 type transport system permease protein